MSNAEIRSIFTDENSIFIDENTPLYTYCGSGDRDLKWYLDIF